MLDADKTSPEQLKTSPEDHPTSPKDRQTSPEDHQTSPEDNWTTTSPENLQTSHSTLPEEIIRRGGAQMEAWHPSTPPPLPNRVGGKVPACTGEKVKKLDILI